MSKKIMVKGPNHAFAAKSTGKTSSTAPKAFFKDNRPQAKQIAQLQGLANNSFSNKHLPIQKKDTPSPTSTENKTGLPDNLKSGIETLSGYSMDDVKVHYNSHKPAQLQAHAYAQGSEIHLRTGQEKHLPHEAWHVVQQKQGRVKPTMQLKGKVNVNDDAGLEREADIMGSRALQQKQESSLPKLSKTSRGVIQRAISIQPALFAQDVMKEVVTSSLFLDIFKKANVYIKMSKAESDMKVAKTHNLDSIQKEMPDRLHDSGIEYIVNIDESVFETGSMQIEAGTSHKKLDNQLAGVHRATLLHDFDLQKYNREKAAMADKIVPIFHLGNSNKGILPGEPFKKPMLDDYLDAEVPKEHKSYKSENEGLSAYTVILHELGHIEQHLRSDKIYSGVGLKGITHKDVPPIPSKLVDKVTEAYDSMNLRSPVWSELIDMNNSMQKWIPPFKDYNEDHDDSSLAGEIAAFTKLGDDIANFAMVWNEYDNISNTEHPAAMDRKEPIRHIHGTEALVDVNAPKRLSRQNNSSTLADLGSVKIQMKLNAYQLTKNLVPVVTRFEELYQKLLGS